MDHTVSCFFVFLFLPFFVCSSSTAATSNFDAAISEEGRCEPITIPMCVGVGYNMTRMPNEHNHETQEEAGLEVHQFWPLVQINCSLELRFFLCSMYAPICLPGYKKPLPPCKGLCRRAREGCEPIMTKYGFVWPESMDCDKFPEFGASQEQLCMDQTGGQSSTTRRPHTNRGSKDRSCVKGSKNCPGPVGGDAGRKCRCQCQLPLIQLSKESSQYNSSVAGLKHCAYPCKETYFNADEKEFAKIWITLWSSLCAISTLMTLTTFCIETERFKYPERPIVFLSACYFMVSIGYLIRVGTGHEDVACDGPSIRYSSSGANLCSLVFILVYFFGMASSVWWVVLSFTWFLAAGLKWGNEAIASYAQYFHLAAWLIPTLQTVAVLMAGNVDGDPVSGICYVGNMNMSNLRTFVLIPLFLYLVVGTTFLMTGFVSLFRIRNAIKRQGGAGAGSKADKLEKLMIRIGIFSVLYTVPASLVIGCYLYENAFHDEWLGYVACTCSEERISNPKVRPVYSVLMLKYFMALAVGITSGVWIWSGKTLDSWRRLWRRLFNTAPPTEANAVLVQKRVSKGQYVVGSASVLGPGCGGGSVASASQHHLHPHVLKQPPLSHV